MVPAASDYYHHFDDHDAYYDSHRTVNQDHWPEHSYSHHYDYYEEPQRVRRRGRRHSVSHNEEYYYPEDEAEREMYSRQAPVYPPRHWSEKEEYREEERDVEEAPTEQEILATENAKRNQYISSEIESAEDDDQTLTEEHTMRHPVTLPSLPRKRCLAAGVFSTLRRKLEDAKRSSRRLTGTHDINIHTILARPTGDILDEHQRQEIVDQLQASGNAMGSSTPTEDAIKVAKLNKIWVFGQEEGKSGPDQDVNVWTGFDFGNQVLIKKYAEQCQRGHAIDEGIELFDSHIRHGELPILVVPTRGLLYYPITKEGGFKSLRVTQLRNSSDVQFVYRAA